jgi:hypothetical protein
VNIEPCPDALTTVTSPPIMRASLRVMARPSPVPPKRCAVEASAWLNSSNSFACCSAVMPMPVSETANSTKLLPLLTLRAASLTSPSLGRGGLEQKEMAMTEAGKNRIMIFGPKNDGTYVIEFKTAAGEALICLACYFAPNRCRDQPQKRPVVQSRGITLSYIARWQMRRASSWGRGKAKERAPTGRGRGSGLTTFTRGSQCSPLAQQNLCWVVGRCLCPRPSPRPARYKESPEGANRGALSGVTLRYRRGERHLPR